MTARTNRKRLALAVDDDRNFLQSMRMMLRVGGFDETLGASDVEEALALLDRRDVDIIVSDWNMDPYDGLYLLRAVRADPANRHIPFILVTASLSEQAWRSAIELGATDFLVKPFSIDQLHESVDLCFALGERRIAAGNVVDFPRSRRRKTA
ncbi:MAG: PleD family two-component system response regulator [Beijerinckiaceae bacterium]